MRAAVVLGLRSARHRPWHRIGLVVAVAAGVALATAVSITTDSAESASTRYLSMFAGPSDVRVVGSTIAGGVTPEMIEQISSTRGVSRVVPMISEISTVTSPDQPDRSVLVLGIDCRWPGVDALGCSPNLLDSIGERPLAVGPGLRSLVGAGRLRTDESLLPLHGTATLDELDRFNDGRVVLLGLDTASELFSRSTAVDTAFVVPNSGINSSALREDIRAAIGDAGTVLSATARSPEVDQVLDAFVPLLNLLGIVTLVMASLVVLGLVRLDFEEHRTHLAVLGAVGATPATLAGVVFVDAVLACAIGGALGSLGGVVVAGPMVAAISTIAERAVGLTVTPELSAATVIEGVLIGVVVAVVAAFTAVRRASRMDIVSELQRRDRPDQVRSPWTRWTAAPIVLGVLAIGGLLLTRINGGISRWQAVIAFPLLAVLVGAMVLGFAALSNLVVRAVRPVARSVGGRTWLAVEGLARDSRRTGTTALAVAAMVTLTMVIGGTIESIRGGVERGLAGDDFVATDGRLTSAQLAAIEQVPGVAGSTRVTSAVLRSGANLVLLNVVTGELDPFPALDGRVADGGLGPGEAAIGAGLARRLGVRAGDTISVAGPRAVIDVPVAAVWDQGAFGGQNITIGPELGATLFDSLAPGRIRFFPNTGVAVDELRARIEHRLGDDGPPLVSRDEMLRRGVREAGTGLGPFRVLQLSLLATAVVSLATTLLRLVTMRRREFATLVAIGDSPGDIRRLVMLEGLLVGSIAAFLGFVAGCVLTVATTWVTPFTVGYRNPVRIDLLSGALAVAGAVVLVAAGSIPAAVSAARRDVVGTLADE